MIKIKLCYDGGTCGNEDFIEDLEAALKIAMIALTRYANGYTWRHFATDALEEIKRLGFATKD